MRKIKILFATITLLVSNIAFADLNTGLTAHYSFDDCKVTDNSGNGNNGKITGTLQCTKGMLNKGLLFDGKSYISVPSSSSLIPLNQWTISFWIRVDAFTGSYSGIIYKGGSTIGNCNQNRDYSVWLAQQTPAFQQSVAGDGSCETGVYSKKVATGKWLHYVGIIDRINHIQKIYIDGQLNVQRNDNYTAFNSTDTDLKIGFSDEPSGTLPFKGALDDIRFYNRALSDNEIKALYSMPQPISGNLKGVQQYSVTCKNVKTGQIKTIPLKDGATLWDCKKAGLTTNTGDNVNISIDAVSW